MNDGTIHRHDFVAAWLKQMAQGQFIEHMQYIDKHGHDMLAIRRWKRNQ